MLLNSHNAATQFSSQTNGKSILNDRQKILLLKYAKALVQKSVHWLTQKTNVSELKHSVPTQELRINVSKEIFDKTK